VCETETEVVCLPIATRLGWYRVDTCHFEGTVFLVEGHKKLCCYSMPHTHPWTHEWAEVNEVTAIINSTTPWLALLVELPDDIENQILGQEHG
jgi:hypothetical protein